MSPESVMLFLEMESYCRAVRVERNGRKPSPRLLERRSKTFSYLRLLMLASELAENLLLFSCSFFTLVRQSVMTLMPASPILFSPKSSDLSPLKD